MDADLFKRLDEDRLEEIEIYDVPGDRGWGNWRKRRLKRYEFWQKLAAFYEEEGVLATIDRAGVASTISSTIVSAA